VQYNKLNLLHLGTERDAFGMLRVSVLTKNKTERRYTFNLSSEYAYRQFLRHYKFGNTGKAFSVLQKFNKLNNGGNSNNG